MLLEQDKKRIINAAKHVNQGITNNLTFNDSSHNNGGSLQQTGTTEVFVENKKEKTVKECPHCKMRFFI